MNEFEIREGNGDFDIPDALSDIHPVPSASVSDGTVARWVHGIMMNDNQTGQKFRLRGLAQVWMDSDEPERFIDRLVLATPLYVEMAPIRPLGRMRKFLRRLHIRAN